MLSRIEAANRNPSCGTMPSWRRSERTCTSRRSWPSMRIAPSRGVVEARQQLDERRLARARVTDQRDGLAGGDAEVDAVQHLGALAVVEVHAAELDGALDLRQRPGALGVAQLGRGVHHVEDLVERRARRQERVEELGERLDRVEEVRQEEHEREQRADRDRVVEVEDAAVGEHDRRRDRAEQADEREVPGVELDRAAVGLPVGVADLAEGARRCRARAGTTARRARPRGPRPASPSRRPAARACADRRAPSRRGRASSRPP